MGLPQNKSLSAYNKALHLLGYKNYTSFELSKKLKQFNFPAKEINEALEKCKELRLINDNETIKYYIENCQLEKKWGYRKIINKLQEKQIPFEQIKFYMKEYYQKELEIEIKTTLLEEKELKLSDTMDKYKKKGILSRFLNQRGF